MHIHSTCGKMQWGKHTQSMSHADWPEGVNLQGSWEWTNTNLWVASNIVHIDSK